MPEDPQLGLFGGEAWDEHWKGMPEFVQKDLTSVKSIHVHFETVDDMHAFAKLVGQKITLNTRSIWYPEAEIGRYADKLYVDEEPAPPPEAPNLEDEIVGEGSE